MRCDENGVITCIWLNDKGTECKLPQLFAVDCLFLDESEERVKW